VTRGSVAVGDQSLGGPCCLHRQGEDGSSKSLRDVENILPQHYTASPDFNFSNVQHRRHKSLSVDPSKRQFFLIPLRDICEDFI
jgi:hypothetical protein